MLITEGTEEAQEKMSTDLGETGFGVKSGFIFLMFFVVLVFFRVLRALRD